MAIISEIKIHHLFDKGLPQLLCEVVDDDGQSGVGECWWGIIDQKNPAAGGAPIASALQSIIAPRVMGKDADLIQAIWFDCADYSYRYGDGGIISMALSGLDMALWDLKARRLDIPVIDLLGGPIHESISAYASLPPLRDRDVLIRETERAMKFGFGAIKLHELDPALTALVREVGGDSLGIMVDVNGHFDLMEAISVGCELAEHDVLWFEEPVRPMRDVNAISRVAESVPIDIAAGENEFSLTDFERLLASEVISYLQPEITKIGGLTPALRVGALCETTRTPLAPHNFRLGPALLASMHFGFSQLTSEWIEVPWVPEGVEFASGGQVPELTDGCVKLPNGPGFGHDLGRLSGR